MFCNYSNIFGEVGKGLHSYRLFNIAIIDVIFTMIGAYVLQRLWFPEKKYCEILFVLFILGIFLQRLFCVQTTVDKFLFT